MECYIGTIMAWAPDFEPRGWMFCDGRFLPIPQHMALFSLLGTTYGGDGSNNFALPNLRGQVPVGAGQSPRGSTYFRGQTGGQEIVTLQLNELPAHRHSVLARDTPGDTGTPAANVCLAKAENSQRVQTPIYSTSGSNITIGPTGDTGGNQPHTNMQPYIVVNYIICVEGIFPSRW